MNDVVALFSSQIGLGPRLSYDCAVKRLRCSAEDDFGQILPEDTENLDPPIFACKFAEKAGYENIVALANEDGKIAVHDTDKGLEDGRFGGHGHYNAIFDLAWMFESMKLVTVSGDHSARLFDVSNGSIVQEQVFQGHTRSVKTVAFRQQDPAVFATGARDGSILVWDTRMRPSASCIVQPDNSIENSHLVNTPVQTRSRKKICSNMSGANSVTGLVFESDVNLVSCGAGDGAIKVWDLRKNYKALHKYNPIPKHIIHYNGTSARYGFSSLVLDRDRRRLYANCMDNHIYCYNSATFSGEATMQFSGHQNSTFYVKSSLSRDGLYLVSGSSDQHAYVWSTSCEEPLVQLVGHQAEVTCVAWSQKGALKVVTCSDDTRHKIWRIGPEEEPVDWPVIGRGSSRTLQQAPPAPLQPMQKVKRPMLERTPCSLRKRPRICVECQLITPNSSGMMNCDRCSLSKRRSAGSKRMMMIIGEADEGSAAKRSCGDKFNGARRLFSPGKDCDSEQPLSSILKPICSPTLNLPNYVLDGQAPHFSNFSPEKKRLQTDWLTQMRREKALVSGMRREAGAGVLSEPSPPKKVRIGGEKLFERALKAHSSTNQRSPKRAQSPLLKFFKVTSGSKTAPSCDAQQCLSTTTATTTTATATATMTTTTTPAD